MPIRERPEEHDPDGVEGVGQYVGDRADEERDGPHALLRQGHDDPGDHEREEQAVGEPDAREAPVELHRVVHELGVAGE